ncbi:MAG: dihydrodipicolinate reductase C-terminal domain-containing protein [Armatimonadota bacterium]
MFTVGLVGLGLTGSAIARYLREQRPDVRLVMAGAEPHSAKAGQDLGALLGLRPCDVSVTPAEDISGVLQHTRPQTAIDFSRPDATLALHGTCARIGCGVVGGVHEVLFAGDHDEIPIIHRTEPRPAFAAGAVDVAVWMAMRRGCFTVEEMIMQEQVRTLVAAPSTEVSVHPRQPFAV